MFDALKVPLYLVEYYVEEGSKATWYWETERGLRMSPPFHDQQTAMEWLESYDEERD